MHVYEATAREIIGGHVVRPLDDCDCILLVTDGSSSSRAAAYSMLTRHERSALARTLGGASAVLCWLCDDADAPDSLTLCPERRQRDRRVSDRRAGARAHRQHPDPRPA